MPLSEDQLRSAQDRVKGMLMETIESIELIKENADPIFGDRAEEIRAAITECLDDFLWNPGAAGETHPEGLIYEQFNESVTIPAESCAYLGGNSLTWTVPGDAITGFYDARVLLYFPGDPPEILDWLRINEAFTVDDTCLPCQGYRDPVTHKIELAGLIQAVHDYFDDLLPLQNLIECVQEYFAE